ncbi:beta-carotene hydroxylase 2, chloroplastic [Ricinus communis]|uniref:beta-carotene 3-hydroxylase n=1 Tax=Ricinus communis TaxID=3988 RepID=B9RIT5_RICCO|nr:beta-carotene hydroxylase 2, chloroplastic [Ricinus communis]EEF49057.1 beta-carotene hydroxylase, putative [Ricinus communis]|eukprot:XP_002513654.1 beta-carotene hydroxylase 2, chloroplastic [Ricinus communis]
MAAGLSAAPVFKPFRYINASYILPKPLPTSLVPPSTRYNSLFLGGRRKTGFAICFVLEDLKQSVETENPVEEENEKVNYQILTPRVAERLARKRSERFTYLVAAVMSSFGITSMAVMACYYRFYWQMEGGEVPLAEMFGTFSLSVGAAVGMEFWARWAHRALWHASLWHMHESHHRPREGPFELNDVFAITNAVPAIGLLYYGFFNKGLFPGLCFGAGLGITVFGMAYMFVHDGLVHKRFPVGPIANVPYFRKVAAAHQLHHSEKFNGVPYGLFLGPKEIEEVGGLEELEKETSRRKKSYNGR